MNAWRPWICSSTTTLMRVWRNYGHGERSLIVFTPPVSVFLRAGLVKVWYLPSPCCKGFIFSCQMHQQKEWFAALNVFQDSMLYSSCDRGLRQAPSLLQDVYLKITHPHAWQYSRTQSALILIKVWPKDLLNCFLHARRHLCYWFCSHSCIEKV